MEPKLECEDALFMLKSFLQDRREKGYDTGVVCIDLVKAHDSIEHKVIRTTLEIFGVPQDIISWIMKLYVNFEVKVKVGKKREISIWIRY